MALAFHADRTAKFDQQYHNAVKNIVPFVAGERAVAGMRVLEIGCGEGGVLKAFLEAGCDVVGVDLVAAKIDYANETFAGEVAAGRAAFLHQDIYEAAFGEAHGGTFDLVILKDTIEHVYGHARLLRLIRTLLQPDGLLFVAFPPWRMPYGGHQQMAGTKLGKLPFYHILPRPLYRGLLRAFGETEEQIGVLMEIVDTRLSIGRFERLLEKCGYQKRRRDFYLINPIYEYKFGLTPRRQLPVLRSLPWLRDFVTTTTYYLVQPR